MLNVHVICHTHLDTGWVETYDDYYKRCKCLSKKVKVIFMVTPIINKHSVDDNM